MARQIGVFKNPDSKEILSENDLISGTYTGCSFDHCFITDDNGKQWKVGYYDCVIYDEDNLPDSLEEIIDALDDEKYTEILNEWSDSEYLSDED